MAWNIQKCKKSEVKKNWRWTNFGVGKFLDFPQKFTLLKIACPEIMFLAGRGGPGTDRQLDGQRMSSQRETISHFLQWLRHDQKIIDPSFKFLSHLLRDWNQSQRPFFSMKISCWCPTVVFLCSICEDTWRSLNQMKLQRCQWSWSVLLVPTEQN